MSAVSQLPAYSEKRSSEDSSIEKEKVLEDVEDVDAQNLKEVGELEERLANDEADEDEYRVQAAYDVATKVCSHSSRAGGKD